MSSQGFSFVGLVSIHTRTATGGKGIGRLVGNCPKLDVKFSPKSVERNESMSVARAPFRRMTQATSATIDLVTDEFNKKNFALAVRARIDEIAADALTVFNEVLPTGVVLGDLVGLQKRNVNTVVITDSTGAPKTLPAAGYTVDGFTGHITVLDITTGGPYVQPFKAAFKQGAVTVMAGLTLPDTDLWLTLDGTNADNGLRGMLDAYRVRLDPAQAIAFINNDYQDFSISGTMLLDSTKLPSAIGGQVFQFVEDSTTA